jgi:hypothetical protein
MTSGEMTAPLPATAPSSLQARPDAIDQIVNGLLMVYLFFFFVGGKITSLPLPVRIEDFIYILLVPMSYRYIGRPKSKLFWLIVAYFSINLIPYFAEAAVGQYSLSIYPVIVIKEIQYLYIAYLICLSRSPWVLGTLDALAIIIIGNGMRAIYAREITYYGIGTFGAYTAPSLAGAIFLFSTIWLHVRMRLLGSRWLKAVAMGFVIGGSLCAVATISRSSIAALIVYWLAYLAMTNRAALVVLLGGFALAPAMLQAAAKFGPASYGVFAGQLLGRASRIGASAAGRSDKWQWYISLFDPIDFVFGRGKGYPNALDKTLGLGVDSQYIRIIIENGFVGFFLLMVIFLMMLREIHRRGGEFQHAWAVMMAMLVMSFPLEALQVSKSGGFFGLIMFYLYMCQRKQPPAAGYA